MGKVSGTKMKAQAIREIVNVAKMLGGIPIALQEQRWLWSGWKPEDDGTGALLTVHKWLDFHFL